MSLLEPTIPDYLVAHATRLVWCSPYEDEQYIIKLAQLSDRNGEIVDGFIFDRILPLPDKRNRFHIYMIGGNHPTTFNLPERMECWMPLENWCMEADFIARIYNSRGILVPMAMMYYYLEDDGNILLAIKQDAEIEIDLGAEDIFIHFRSSNYYRNDPKEPRNKRVYIDSRHYIKGDDITDMATEFINRYEQDYHSPMAFVNGRLTNNLYRVEPNQYVELEDDGAVKHVEYFRVSSLRTFQSGLDSANKYLIMLASTKDKNIIHYRDDVELFLVHAKRKDIFDYQKQYPTATLADAMDHINFDMSVYYHRNREDSLRMVTNQAYSAPVDYIHSLIRDVDERFDLDNWYVKVIVRSSGLDRRMIAERHRVMELNQLSYEDKLNAMTDTESNVRIWKASELEKSQFNFIMRAYREEITPERIIAAYGYDQSVLALANPNITITKTPNQNFFILPPTLAPKCTVYEYDRTGKLLGWYHVTDTIRYLPSHEETIFVEAISGYGTSALNWFQDVGVKQQNYTIGELANYRIYRLNKTLDDAGLVQYTGDFTDVTKHVTDFVQRNDGFTFTNHTPDKARYDVIGDNTFLCRDLYLTPGTDGVVDFTLVTGETNQLLEIAPSKLCVWLDGKALIEGIDYHLDFPRVVIVAKQLLKNRTEEDVLKITYRALGFSKTLTKVDPPREVGFIIDNRMSVDYHYDLHQNKISRITVGGGVFNPSLFNFDTQYGEAKVNAPTGTPYQIDDHYISIQGLAGYKKVYDFQENDRAASEQIQDYLRGRVARPELPTITVVEDKYELYSPFMSAIVKHVLKNEAKYLNLDYHNKSKVAQLASRFKHFLKTDPCVIGYDIDFCVVDPLPYTSEEKITLHHRIYGLFEQINKIYLNEQVELNRVFSITRTRKKEQE